MSLIKKFFKFFSPVEVLVLAGAITISTFLVIPALTNKGSSSEDTQIGIYVYPDEYIFNTDGGNFIYPFDTEFFIRYEETTQTIKNEIIQTLNELLVPHHKLFDRHNAYYAIQPANPRYPTPEEKATLPRLINLNYINNHKGERLEVAKPLYDLLAAGKEYSLIAPENAFSMFIGELYDFWAPHTTGVDVSKDPLNNPSEKAKLERLQSFIPQSAEDINNTLILEEVSGKYYVTFNEFNGSGDDLSISVGAIGKGLMVDILTAEMMRRGLTKGFVDGGSSSITFLGRGFYGKNYEIKLASILPDKPRETTFTFARSDQYQISTSGIYMGKRFMHDGQEIIRSHIIDPKTGYPVQNSHHMVNIISNTFSGLELDFLTTTLVVLSPEVGMRFIQDTFSDNEINVAYVGIDEDGVFYIKNRDYPGQNTTKFSVNSEYKEKFPDLL